ncbi:hypothetical protein [Desulfosporosinus nitroreducens]|uniref:Uncharacterized protein n=1 Tax=Desulfosporosinus nitroreducens TaxID=2018668 RepID=A0ABT8QTA5_9FIRM|nr:hypothetical protein [Desulfosporosinus nitroreducens]MCO1602906.1 hypothetical protein [Desulfosporosinus nitroreducens]MDO0824593.1 hypothetical protein [Desulfosporosinus nitroreducens]
MNNTSKCSRCINKESCHIRSNLNKIIQEVIKKSEADIQELSPKEIDYMILTDISIIPTRCENYQCRHEPAEKRGRLFTFRRMMATAAV